MIEIQCNEEAFSVGYRKDPRKITKKDTISKYRWKNAGSNKDNVFFFFFFTNNDETASFSSSIHHDYNVLLIMIIIK